MAQGSEAADRNMDDVIPIMLHDALMADDDARVEELVTAGADVNHVFHSGVFYKHAVHICCDKGCVKSLQVLIRHGADLEVGDQWGQRPLHDCVKKRRNNILDVLLRSGCNVNARDGYGRSPIFYAVELGDRVIFNVLLTAGASVNFQDIYGQTPVHVAASRKIFEDMLLRMLKIEGVDVNLLDRRKRTPLQHAVISGSLGAVQALLMAKADPNLRDYQHMSALMNSLIGFSRSAVEEEYLEKTEWLIKFGADVNLPCAKTGRSPLHTLVGTRQTCYKLFELLVRFGADINKRDHNGCSPLMMALLAGNKQAVRLLIRENCDTSLDDHAVVQDDAAPGTAIDVCISHSYLDMLELLLACGKLDYQKYYAQVCGDSGFLSDKPDMMSMLHYHLMTVPSLMRLSRIVIRGALGTSPCEKACELGLPKALCRYVLLENELNFE